MTEFGILLSALVKLIQVVEHAGEIRSVGVDGRIVHSLAVMQPRIIFLFLLVLVPEEGIQGVVRNLHADQNFVIRVVLLYSLLKEAVEDVPQRLDLVDAHLVQSFVLLDLARI